MIEIALVGAPTTATTRWLQKYFGGQAILRDFAKHFSENYRSRNGTIIPPKNVYARICKDVQQGIVKRRTRKK